MEEKDGMMGGLKGVGSVVRKRRGVCGCNEVAHLLLLTTQ